jgi:hypothetical protein
VAGSFLWPAALVFQRTFYITPFEHNSQLCIKFLSMLCRNMIHRSELCKETLSEVNNMCELSTSAILSSSISCKDYMAYILYSCNPFANYHVLTGHCVANVCVCACAHCCAVVLFFIIVPGLKFEDPVFFLGF